LLIYFNTKAIFGLPFTISSIKIHST